MCGLGACGCWLRRESPLRQEWGQGQGQGGGSVSWVFRGQQAVIGAVVGRVIIGIAKRKCDSTPGGSGGGGEVGLG